MVVGHGHTWNVTTCQPCASDTDGSYPKASRTKGLEVSSVQRRPIKIPLLMGSAKGCEDDKPMALQNSSKFNPTQSNVAGMWGWIKKAAFCGSSRYVIDKASIVSSKATHFFHVPRVSGHWPLT